MGSPIEADSFRFDKLVTDTDSAMFFFTTNMCSKLPWLTCLPCGFTWVHMGQLNSVTLQCEFKALIFTAGENLDRRNKNFLIS